MDLSDYIRSCIEVDEKLAVVIDKCSLALRVGVPPVVVANDLDELAKTVRTTNARLEEHIN